MAQAAVPIPPTERLLADAMALPEPDRAKLVVELLRSLSPVAEQLEQAVEVEAAEADPVLADELRRRQAHLSGETGSVSIEELESELDHVIAAVHR